MKLEQSFDVQAPLDEVWSALIDLERVAPCLPGASITRRDDDGAYHGEFQVKLGPTTASYRGTIRIEDVDESAHVATLRAKGSDKRGQGGASATIVNTVTEVDGVTRVDAVTDFTITGRLASFGRGGMMKDISNRLLKDFATCLQARLAGGVEEEGASATAAPAEPPPAGAGLPTPEAVEAAVEAAPSVGDAPREGVAGVAGSPQPSAAAGLPTPAAVEAVKAAAPPSPSVGGGSSPDLPASGRPAQPAPPASAPLDAGSLLAGALRDRLTALYRALARLFGRPGR